MNEDTESREVQWPAKGLTTRLVAEIEIDSTPKVLESPAPSTHRPLMSSSPVAGISKREMYMSASSTPDLLLQREGEWDCTCLLSKETVSLFSSRINPYRIVLILLIDARQSPSQSFPVCQAPCQMLKGQVLDFTLQFNFIVWSVSIKNIRMHISFLLQGIYWMSIVTC